MFERLFPNIARTTREWPAAKWLAFPAIFVLLFCLLIGVARSVMEAVGWVEPTIF
jgi:uncharacterized MAPEG superfamily protein